MDSFGNLMREELERHGYSLRAACRAMVRDPGFPSRVMNGKEPPSRALAEDLDQLLGTEKFTTTLQRQAAPKTASASDDAVSAIELARLATLSEVGSDTLDLLEQSFNDMAISYQSVRPVQLLTQVRGHLEYVGRLLQKRTTLREHRSLLHLAAWNSLLAATLNVDLRNADAASAQLRTAVSLANEAGTPVIAAWSLETEAWQALTLGHYPRALDLAQRAQEAAPTGSSALVQATAQEGRAWARLGRVDETRKAIRRVEALATQDPSQPRHHFCYDPAKQLSYAATALAWAGDATAERAAREVIAAYPIEPNPERWPRRLTTANLDLALALAKRGKLDESAGFVGQVLESGKVVPSTRWRVEEVINRLEPLPESSELREMLDGS